jgi:hypothetical protein
VMALAAVIGLGGDITAALRAMTGVREVAGRYATVHVGGVHRARWPPWPSASLVFSLLMLRPRVVLGEAQFVAYLPASARPHLAVSVTDVAP